MGADLGEDVEHLGTNTLVWKVAEINAEGNKSYYGSAYNTAVLVLKKPGAAQSEADAALAELVTGGGADTGGGCDTGASWAIALFAMRSGRK
ncbi:MAG: hypothetical protein LBS75_08200 [Synergistaceae bacterium]|nr:hypothetical protein [Synergistaceae bacterium]